MENNFLKLENEDFKISFDLIEICHSLEDSSFSHPKYSQEQIDLRIASLRKKIKEFDDEIDTLKKLKAMLQKASESEISDIARQELTRMVQQLAQRKDLLERIASIEERIASIEERMNKIEQR